MNTPLKIIAVIAVIGLIIIAAIFAPSIKTPDEPVQEVITMDQQIKTYFNENLSEISPEKEVLGGKFYVTALTVATTTYGQDEYVVGEISYEDGHNAYDAVYTLTVIAQNSFEVREIILIGTSSSNGITFQYPLKLPTTYISAQDWPPKVKIVNAPYSCVEEEKTINSHKYCVTVESEGAAGSTYTSYAYSLPLDDKTVTFNFTLKSVRCDNYNDPEKTECELERDGFDVDIFFDVIASTAVVI